MSFGVSVQNSISIGLGGVVPIGVRGSGGFADNVFAGAAAAYSLRIPYGGTYNGPIIRVRRSSDNAEQDILASVVVDGNGNQSLDTVALLAFVGSGSGFITTWYDQSGNGINATQATAAKQPRIVNSGFIDSMNGLTSVYFNGSQSLSTANFSCGVSQFTANVVFRNSTFKQNSRALIALSSTDTFDYATTTSAALIYTKSSTEISGYRNNAQMSIANSTFGNPVIVTTVYNGSNNVMSLNGNSGASVNNSGSLGANISLSISTPISTEQMIGFVSEVIWMHSALLIPSRQTLERNQGSYYGITVA